MNHSLDEAEGLLAERDGWGVGVFIQQEACGERCQTASLGASPVT